MNLITNEYLSFPIMDEIRCAIIGADSKEISMVETILKSIDPENKFLKDRYKNSTKP